jgi:hypothetical protein
MRKPLFLLPAALLLTACQAPVTGFTEVRLNPGAFQGAAPTGVGLYQTPAPAAVPPKSSPLVGTTLPASETVVKTTAAAPKANEQAVKDGPDMLSVFGVMREYVGAYEKRDSAKVAEFESVLLAARRKADTQTQDQFKVSLEEGRAAIFVKGKNLAIVTAQLTNIALVRAGKSLTIRTKDGSPVLKASFELDGEVGVHEIAELVFVRDADGKVKLASLPPELVGVQVPEGLVAKPE